MDTLNKDMAFEGLVAKAREVVVRHQKASVSLVQRHLRTGYSLSCRILSALEGEDVVSSPDENGIRRVLAAGRIPSVAGIGHLDTETGTLPDLLGENLAQALRVNLLATDTPTVSTQLSEVLQRVGPAWGEALQSAACETRLRDLVCQAICGWLTAQGAGATCFPAKDGMDDEGMLLLTATGASGPAAANGCRVHAVIEVNFSFVSELAGMAQRVLHGLTQVRGAAKTLAGLCPAQGHVRPDAFLFYLVAGKPDSLAVQSALADVVRFASQGRAQVPYQTGTCHVAGWVLGWVVLED